MSSPTLVLPIHEYTLFAQGRYVPGESGALILTVGEAEVLNSALEEKVLRGVKKVWPGHAGAILPAQLLLAMQAEAERLAQTLALGGPRQLWRSERLKEFTTLCAHEGERLGVPPESRGARQAALALMAERYRRAAEIISASVPAGTRYG